MYTNWEMNIFVFSFLNITRPFVCGLFPRYKSFEKQHIFREADSDFPLIALQEQLKTFIILQTSSSVSYNHSPI